MIHTVLGPVDAASIGRVDIHEHVLTDSSGLHRPGQEPAPADLSLDVRHLGYLRWNALALAANLRLDDVDTAVEELAELVPHGVDLVVDATPVGLGPRHAELPGISRRAGVGIVSAYGAYVDWVLPEWMLALDEDALAEHFRAALVEGIPGVDYTAGLLGIMGTGGDVTDAQRMRLRAAGRAAAETGAAVSVRLDGEHRPGLRVLELLVAQGMDPAKVLFTNVDEYLDVPYLRELSAAGATLEMCFGTEAQHVGRMRNAADHERLDVLEGLLRDAPGSRWVLGGSTWLATQLRRHGGYGYAHMIGRIVPELRRRGLDAALVERLVTAEPRRLLDRPV